VSIPLKRAAVAEARLQPAHRPCQRHQKALDKQLLRESPLGTIDRWFDVTVARLNFAMVTTRPS